LGNIYAIPYTLSRSLSKSPYQIKALALPKKHLNSADRKVVRVRIPVPAFRRIEQFAK